MTSITIDDETARRIVSGAILAGIGDDARDQIISQAVAHLLAPEITDRYGRKEVGPSVLEQAFKTALNGVVYELTREFVTENDEVREQVLAAVGPLVNDLLLSGKDDDTELRRRVTDVIVEYAREKRGF